MPAPAYCPHCFYALDAEAVTCPRCGQGVGNTAAPAPALSTAPNGGSEGGPAHEETSAPPPLNPAYARYMPPPGYAPDPAFTTGPAVAEDDSPPAALPVRPVSPFADSLNGDAPVTSLPVRAVGSETIVMPLDAETRLPDPVSAPPVAAIVPPETYVPAHPDEAVPAPVLVADAPPSVVQPLAPAPPVVAAEPLAPPEPVVQVVPVALDAPPAVWTSAPAPAPVVAPLTGTKPAVSTTAGAMVLLSNEEVITQIGALYLTNKRVLLYAPSILRAAFLRDVDAVGTLTERASGWSLFVALFFLGLAVVTAFVMLTQNQVAFSVGSAIQLPMWLLALGLAAVGGVLLGTYFFWIKKSLFLSVGGRPLIVISLSGWSPKRLEGVDTFVNTFSQAKDAVEHPPRE